MATPSSFLARATPLVELGYLVFPLGANSKVPAIPKKLGGHGFLDATRDMDIIRGWAKSYPKANVGIATGHGLYIIDEDRYKGGDAGPLRLEPTLMSVTARGGYHYWYQIPRGLTLPDTTDRLGPNIDTRGDGGYIVGPGSVVDNQVYRFHTVYMEPCPTDGLPLIAKRFILQVQAPEPLLDEAPPRRDMANHTDAGAYWLDWALRQSHDGTGDITGYKLAQQLLVEEKNGAPVDVNGVLMSYAIQATVDTSNPFDDKSVARWVEQAAGSRIVSMGDPARSRTPKRSNDTTPTSKATPRASETHTDGNAARQPEEERQADPMDSSQFGLARLLMARHGPNMRYNRSFGFIVWDGVRWKRDADLIVQQWTFDLIQHLCDVTPDKEDGKPADINKRRTAMTIDAVMRLVRPMCNTSIDIFDTHPFLFNVQNGTLDLRTGEKRAHCREDFLTQLSPLVYDPTATCDQFGRFVEEIMMGQEDLVMYLQRFLGYCMTGDTSEQVWHLAVGPGSNGKTTIMELVARVMGDYAGVMEPEAICISGRPSDANAASPATAALVGKRFIRITETEQGARLAAARVKRYAGEDVLSARFLHKGIFEFYPQFKMVIYTNHKPRANETGHAFWRRVRMVPFNFKPIKPDKELKKRLWAEEAQGILAWLVRGAAMWAANGLQAPKEVMDATAQYERESDTLGLFLEERVEFVEDAQPPARSKALYDAYKDWCEEAGEKNYLSLRQFSITLSERGYRKREDRDANVWIDLRIKQRGPLV